MLNILLYFAIGYLLFISVVMIMNLRDFKPMQPSSDLPDVRKPFVSICIPARNEERNIKRSVRSVLAQKYSSFEVLVLDDESTDQTPDILNRLIKKYPEKLLDVNSKSKPNNWLGKSWACHQLSQKARGDILFFIDADVWLEPDAVNNAVQSMNQYSVDFVTIWPLQKLGSFWEKVVIPIVYYGLLGLLPTRYVHKKPSWIPASLENRTSPLFAAACGQCMIFKRSAYEAIGGHQSVKNDIVEDVALAKQIKRNGFRMRMFHGAGTATCRMYRSANEMWQGFRKNFLALFNDSIPAFVLMAIINFVVYVLPVYTFIEGLAKNNIQTAVLSAVALSLVFIHRLILARWYQWKPRMSFLHPLGVLWFHALGVCVFWDHLIGQRARWKNRPTT